MAGRSFPNAGQDLLRVGFLIVLLASLSLIASPVQAATITVTTLADEVLDDGLCSFREALLNAEGNDQSGSTDCTAGSDADTIGFDGVSGTIILGSNLPYIYTAITIDGGGSIAISGGGAHRVLYIGYSGNVTLNNLTITNGYDYNGSAIMNDGMLTVANSVIANNTARYYGGAIWNRYGTATLINSTVANNTASDGGGGIYNGSTYSQGTLILNNTTVAGNSTGADGGGGIYNSAGTVTIINSTFSDNRATANGGGGINNRSGTVTLGNTIVANSPSGGDCANAGTINAVGGNLVEDGSCGFPVGGDPLLGAFTGAYFPLLSGSPAIDAGDNAICPTIDQRGVARPQDGNGDGSAICDLGSYELLPPPTVTINQAIGQADPTNTSPITFEVVFSEDVTGFDAADVSFAGSTVGGALSAIVTGSGANYTVDVTGMNGTGVVVVSVSAGAAMDIDGNLNAASTSTDNSVTFDNVTPTVTIDQAAGQADPTNTSPITFEVGFSENVTGLDATDISFAGSTVGGTLSATVTGSDANYTIYVTGMSGTGNLIVSIPADVAWDAVGNGNLASISTDNSVAFDNKPPTVTIDQAAGQADPTDTSPIRFEIQFSEIVVGFDATDISFAGSTVGGTLVVNLSGYTDHYTLDVTGMSGSGTVIVSVPAGVGMDLVGNTNAASTSTDNSVTFDDTIPPPLTVTINQVPGQADPTNTSPITFEVVFSEIVADFDATDISFAGSTVGGTLTAIVTGSGAHYTVEVSGMSGMGTVIVSIPAGAAQGITGNLSLISTSDDNCVTFDDTAPLVTDTPTPTSTPTMTFTPSDTPVFTSTPTATLIPPTATVPPPPPAPLCEDHNFAEGGVVRSSMVDGIDFSVNCRVLYQNGQPTQWLGGDLYNAGSIGNQGVLDLGVQQALDIFSPNGATDFEGGAVFCLRGEGTLIWLAASGAPRHAEIIGSYEVDDFPGFTCATLFEPGTLVLVRDNPVE